MKREEEEEFKRGRLERERDQKDELMILQMEANEIIEGL